MNEFSLLIKPASADCNLSCHYCFYLEKRKLYPQLRIHRMSDLVLERLIKGYLSTRQKIYTFGWQGGEPTVMGINFFKRITEFQKKYARHGSQIANGLQTNATLINDAMAEHFAQNNFLLGCSLDGPPEIHNHYRKFPSGKPSHAAVMSGIEILRRHRVEFNILILVSKANVLKAKTVYRYLADQGFYHHQYIPCVEFNHDGKPLPFSISGEEWGRFLCEIFDCWYPRDIHNVSIRHLDAILNKRIYGIESVCYLSRNCCQYFVVEYNGDIYPCDFFVDKGLLIGNISDTTWEKALSSPIYQNFGSQKSTLSQDCQECSYLDWCMGDCQKYRVDMQGQLPGISHLCAGWRHFFNHSKERIEALENRVKANWNMDQIDLQSSITANKKPAVGRNQPCPCGSGRKYKKCCLQSTAG